jgi:hypothetical protein
LTGTVGLIYLNPLAIAITFFIITFHFSGCTLHGIAILAALLYGSTLYVVVFGAGKGIVSRVIIEINPKFSIGYGFIFAVFLAETVRIFGLHVP